MICIPLIYYQLDLLSKLSSLLQWKMTHAPDEPCYVSLTRTCSGCSCSVYSKNLEENFVQVGASPWILVVAELLSTAAIGFICGLGL